MRLNTIGPITVATTALMCSVVSLLVPWFACERDQEPSLVREPAIAFKNYVFSDERPWWGDMPLSSDDWCYPRSGSYNPASGYQDIRYRSDFSADKIALVRHVKHTATVFTVLDILAWAGSLILWAAHRKPGAWMVLTWAFVVGLFLSLALTMVIWSWVQNFCNRTMAIMWETHRISSFITGVEITLQEIYLLPAGPALLVAGTLLQGIAILAEDIAIVVSGGT